MPPLETYNDRPVVLLTNDDGPPCKSSPNIFSFCKLLGSKLGWDVRVVIPDCQKSWVGKAYAISDIITASYFYPLEPDGLKGEITTVSRPLKEGETMEWVLLSGTPATCANIALHNLYPGEIDLVVSGPNHGRNSSTAFALSSGTLGAALAASLSVPIPGPSSGASLHIDHIPCIAVSYGVVTRPVSPRVLELATDISVDVCKRLFDDWGQDTAPGGEGMVPIFSVNVPLVETMLEKDNKRVVWTNMWRNAYSGLFKTTQLDPVSNWWSNAPKPNQPSNSQSFASALKASLATAAGQDQDQSQGQKSNQGQLSNIPFPRSKTTYDPGDDPTQSSSQNPSRSKPNIPLLSTTSTAGPGALPTPDPSSPTVATSAETEKEKQLKFHFAPNMQPLLFPSEDTVPEGTDAWAFAKGWVSVTPMRAEYTCVGGERVFGADIN